MRGSTTKHKAKKSPDRERLSRERVIKAAIGIAETEGIEAVTMRRVASSLGSGVMSLYRHVLDRDDLLLGMLDDVAEAIEPPPLERDERAEILAIMKAIHSEFREHPWIVKVLLFEGRGSLLILPLIERIFAALDRLGHAQDSAIEIYSLLLHYCYGESLSFQTTAKRRSVQKQYPIAEFDEFPMIRAAYLAGDDWKYDEFERNIKRILSAA
ncbi:MAG: hypothetical protein AAGA50_04520 [Pseudomonadota bacterium]